MLIMRWCTYQYGISVVKSFDLHLDQLQMS